MASADVDLRFGNRLLCVSCVGAAKMYTGPKKNQPKVKVADMIFNGNTLCVDCLEVQQPSSLVVPATPVQHLP
jgi:hypothetical protein